jgi:hypothetical protein
MSMAGMQTVCDFLMTMMQMDPEERASPEDLLLHRWLHESGSPPYPCKCGAGEEALARLECVGRIIGLIAGLVAFILASKLT